MNIYPEHWVAIFLTLVLGLMVYLEKSHGFDFNGWLPIVTIVWLIYFFGQTGSTFFRYEREFGEYSGKLTFFKDKIKVDQIEFELSEIAKLDFDQAFDIRGNFKYSPLATPHLSNGLSNVLLITLKDGRKIKQNFFQSETERLKHFKEVLIHYHKRGVLGWLQLLDILEIKDYEDIQEFKKKR